MKGAAILEVIACSVADAVEAEKGGANRLEVVSDLDRGGLTPPVELVRAIQDAVNLPLRVMVRESDGYQTSGETEIEKLCTAADVFSKLDVDGLGIGRRGAQAVRCVDPDPLGVLTRAAPIAKIDVHAHLDLATEVDAVDELQKAVNEMLTRLFSVGNDIDA